MKKILLVLAGVVLMAGSAFAQQKQDVIYLKNGSSVRGTIVEQVPNESIKIQTDDGSVFFYAITDVEKMTKEGAIKNHNWKVKYRGEVNFGYATGGKLKDVVGVLDSDVSRPYIETIHGVSIADYIFVGGGFGVQYYYGKQYEDGSDKWNNLTLPIFGNIKGMYPVTDHFKPYISVSLGGTVVATSDLNEKSYGYSTKLKGGFYYDLGIGFQYKKLNFGVGMQHQDLKFEEVYLDDW